MAADPEPIRRVDRYLATARIAHETSWELHTRLVGLGRDDAQRRQLVRESARIATVEVPALLREARRLCAAWTEQQVLDQTASDTTLLALEGELDRHAVPLGELIDKQRAIARELRDLAQGTP
jgi:hypothetical protein